jgi:hypothetical protein
VEHVVASRDTRDLLEKLGRPSACSLKPTASNIPVALLSAGVEPEQSLDLILRG